MQVCTSTTEHLSWPYATAVAGTPRHLEGEVNVTVPPGTQPDEVLRLRHRGCSDSAMVDARI
ncbi:MAG: hypothetical protein LJE75_08875 [Gammaproteobacteria bacterium]|nr:hypothetical protein [Gammaproteobacteria bacterium]